MGTKQNTVLVFFVSFASFASFVSFVCAELARD